MEEIMNKLFFSMCNSIMGMVLHLFLYF